MRLIDADKFLDLLKNSSEGFWRKKQMVNGEPLSEAMSYEMNTIRKCVADADAKAEYAPKWKRVEDGLPEESGLYLILCREENTLHDTVEFNPYLDMYYPNSNPTSWERWSNDYYDKSKVVAWMPIPKYEGVSE